MGFSSSILSDLREKIVKMEDLMQKKEINRESPDQYHSYKKEVSSDPCESHISTKDEGSERNSRLLFAFLIVIIGILVLYLVLAWKTPF